jgi:multidrug efflux pump subunit AcrB
MRAIIQFLVQRDLLVNLISVMLVLMGTWAVFDINREAFPNVNLDQIRDTH